MNKKGFTLVEIIATISIMLLITTLAVPAVISLLSKSEDKLDNAVKKQLVSYAKTYMKDNDYVNNINAFEEGEIYCISIDDLTDENFVDQDNNEIKGRIEIKVDNNQFKYEYSNNSNDDYCIYNSEWPTLIVNHDSSELILTPNKNPEIDPDTILGKSIKLCDDGYMLCEFNTIPDFHEPQTMSTLYKTYDDYGTTYYFRGGFSPYIKLGNIEFQIIRFTGKGNIRAVATQPIKENNIVKQIDYDGVYENSILEQELKKWHENNMQKYESFLVKEDFCVNEYEMINSDLLSYWRDTGESHTLSPIENIYSSIARLDYDNKKINPTYSCYNPSKSFVGTLTADEVVFAGAVPVPFRGLAGSWDYSLDDKFKNTDFYLFRDNGYITLTKAYSGGVFDYNNTFNPVYNPSSTPGYTMLYQFNGNETENVGNVMITNLGGAIYPVINIRGDVKVIGSGFYNDAWIVDTSMEVNNE
ncbi:MAG: type II secretion system protein [Bacilli bacterium]|nr:type II secretion system protein [Bacilli bacterium]